MKHTKKLLALALAMMMALSCMSMPAMAIESRFATINMNCNTCRGFRDFKCIPDGPERSKVITVGGCSKTNFSHQHKISYYNAYYECTDCRSTTMRHTVQSGDECYYKG